MARSRINLRYRLFGSIARLDVRRPWLVLTVAGLLSLVSILYTKARLEFRTGQDDLISADRRDSRNYLRYTREFPDLDGLIIVVGAQPSSARAERFVDTLAAGLNADRTNVKSVFYRVDPAMMGERALLYLSVDELRGLASRIDQNAGMLRSYAAEPTLVKLFTLTNSQIDARLQMAMAAARQAHDAVGRSAAEGADPGLMSTETAASQLSASGPSQAGGEAMNLEFIDALLAGMLAGPAGNSSSSPWNVLSPANQQSGGIRDGYLSSDSGKYLLLEVAATDGAANGPDPVEEIQNELNAVRRQFPDVKAGMTGGGALARAEQNATRHDMALASVIAVIGLILLLVIPFRGVVEPLFAILTLLAGVAWSFGFTTLAVGHLNLLSAVFTSILVGIGINFPIHLMARYDEARCGGTATPAALELAVVNTGTGVFASACIMALAFLMPMFTDFRGIVELGEVSAAALFFCLLSAMFVFPSLIALRDQAGARVAAATFAGPAPVDPREAFRAARPDRRRDGRMHGGRTVSRARRNVRSGRTQAAGERRGGSALREHLAARFRALVVVRSGAGAYASWRRAQGRCFSEAGRSLGHRDDRHVYPGRPGREACDSGWNRPRYRPAQDSRIQSSG